jgi:hypothetical protein
VIRGEINDGSICVLNCQKQSGDIWTIWLSYTIEIVNARTGGKVNDEPGSTVNFTFVGD